MIDFDDFWAAYPRKQDKKKARSKWSRLSNRVKLAIMDDIAIRYIGVERQFIPMPTTYMNGERWEDDIIPVEEEKPTHISSDDFIRQEIERKMQEKQKPAQQEINEGLDYLQQMKEKTR